MSTERYKVTLGVFVVLLRNREGSLETLLADHNYGQHFWGLLGGGVEKPANHQHCWSRLMVEVQREIAEEARLRPADVLLSPLVLSTLSPDSNDHRTLFIGTIAEGAKPAVGDEREIKRLAWFSVDALPEKLYFPQGIYIAEAVRLWPNILKGGLLEL